MSNKQTQQRAENVRAYLQGIGREISSSQAYEVVARALGHKNKHTLAAAETDASASVSQLQPASALSKARLKVFEIDGKPFSARELAQRQFKVDVVVPVEMSTLQADDLEGVNDLVSELITGSCCGLLDIGYEVYPHFYGPDFVAVRVTAQVDNEGELGLSEDAQALLYQLKDKRELAQALQRGKHLEMTFHLDAPAKVEIDGVDRDLRDALAGADSFVAEDGMVTDMWEALRHQTVMSVSPVEDGRPEHKVKISLEELVYATVDEGVWHVDIYTDEGRLTYRFKVI
jgi:hypothetical protein